MIMIGQDRSNGVPGDNTRMNERLIPHPLTAGYVDDVNGEPSEGSAHSTERL